MTKQTTNETETQSTSLLPRAQDAAWRTLVTMSQALPQGLVLVGPPGVGKRRAAKALFQLLTCANRANRPNLDEEAGASLFGPPADAEPEAAPDNPGDNEPCGRCISCRKIAEGRHTDLLELSPKGDSIPVDDLRAMRISLHYPPMEAQWRFVILDDAHRLSTASANALLKVLEEPPVHTRFFLVTHERSLLLPTITSRCQFVRFAPLDDRTLTELLQEQGHAMPEKLRSTMLALLAGGLDRASMITDDKTVEFLEAAERQLAARAVPGRAGADPWAAAVPLAEHLATQSDAGDWKTELLLDLIVLHARRDATASRDAESARRFTRRALEATFLRRRLERHANKKLIALAAADLATATGPEGA